MNSLLIQRNRWLTPFRFPKVTLLVTGGFLSGGQITRKHSKLLRIQRNRWLTPFRF